MTFDFKKLSEVPLLEEIPEDINSIVETGGEVRRIKGGAGGGAHSLNVTRFLEEGTFIDSSDAPFVMLPLTKGEALEYIDFLSKQQRLCLHVSREEARVWAEAMGESDLDAAFSISGDHVAGYELDETIGETAYFMFYNLPAGSLMAALISSSGDFSSDTIRMLYAYSLVLAILCSSEDEYVATLSLIPPMMAFQGLFNLASGSDLS